jgi:adenylate cyclase
MDTAAESSGRSQRLREILQGLGTDEADIERAAADGTLALLAVERLMVPEPARFDLDEVVKRTGLDSQLVIELWRSLGYPDPRPGETVFTDTDVEILDRVADLVAVNQQAAAVIVQISRVIGSSIARIASAQVDLISGPQISADSAEPQIPDDQRVVEGLGSLLPVVPRVFEVVWRRHLRAAARRRMLVVAGDEETSAVVGFADLVGFTALSQQVSDAELARIVTQFENLSFDVITAAGGRVVKLLGDEVMFTVPQPEAGADIALSLVEATQASAELPEVRVGMSYGPVLEREGDLYGPVVNLASRATVIAHPGSVVVDPAVAEQLAGDPAYDLRRMRPRYLKDIGRIPLCVLRRPSPTA